MSEDLKEELEIVDESEAEEDQAEEVEEVEAEEDAAEEVDESASEEEEPEQEFSISIDGEESDEEVEEEENTPVIRTLRRELREAKKELKRIAKEKEEASTATELPEMPKLVDFDYDDERFASAMEDWVLKKDQIEKQKRAEQEEREATQRAFEERQSGYNVRKKQLKAPDFDDAESVVDELLSVQQRGMLIDAAERPEHVVYALGKKPKLAAELAKQKNPVRFIAEIVRLEGKIKVGTTKKAPAPEKRVSGSVASSSNKTLEQLREQAARTGDFTEVTKYKRQMREQEKRK